MSDFRKFWANTILEAKPSAMTKEDIENYCKQIVEGMQKALEREIADVEEKLTIDYLFPKDENEVDNE
jgi:hypothetical protein